MKNFCIDLREHVTKIINYEKKELITLPKEEKKYIVNKKFVIYAKKDLVLMMLTINKYSKVRDHFHLLENTEVLLMISSI